MTINCRLKKTQKIIDVLVSKGFVFHSCQPTHDGRGDHLRFRGAEAVMIYHTGATNVIGRNQKSVREVLIVEGLFQPSGRKQPYVLESRPNGRVHKDKPRRIFIGHGRSLVWRELKDFIEDRLNLEWDEFNREEVAGLSTKERLLDMLDASDFAFLVMTAEDEHADGSKHARENIIHEAGLFQGRLGFEKAIVLLEMDCSEFSNIHGITQIRFPRRNIEACFEKIRRVLEREGII